MKYLSKIAWMVLVALIATGCLQKERQVVVVSLNDMHANIDNFPKFAGLMDSLRSVYPDLLLLSAGDNRTGNPINDRYKDPSIPMVELMNATGFDLSVLGNHEFDGGQDELAHVIEKSDFDYVCANIHLPSDSKINVSPYKILEVNGVKIGVIGGIQIGKNGLPDSHPLNLEGIKFDSIANVLPAYIDELREKCDLLFLLSHGGHEYERFIASRFPELDAIFGGHSHTKVADMTIVNGVLITQSECKLKYVTLSKFTLKKGKVTDKSDTLISIPLFETENADVRAMVDQYNSDETFQQVVANVVTPFSNRESLGCLMTDAIRYEAEADMGFQNPGGVRCDSLSAGPLTLKEVYRLDPFSNDIVAFTLSGEEIVNMIRCCWFTDGGAPHCSGCTYSFKLNENDEISNLSVMLENGKPLDLKAKYKIVMNSYMASVLDFDHEDPGQSTFQSSNKMLLDYLQDHPDIDYHAVARVRLQH